MKMVQLVRASWFAFRAFLDNKSGRYTEALKNCDKALSFFPEHHGAYCYKGTALYKLGQYNEALEAYSRSWELQPKSEYVLKKGGFQLLNNIGSCYMKIQQEEKAMEFFNNAIKLNSSDYKAYACKACAYALQNKKGEAIENLQNAVTLNPNYRKEAKADGDYRNIRAMPEFVRLVGD